ncbi:hypothetical protein SBOR_8191 [Sclerotinia borealis F-4128]|uniref:Carrier domain-containing protein n=1 Tax=Sclerotinia borealis (strain F-4128) TaxID=1432307 RepID=W9C3U8_SCLBF|nr:hypothetical protein SBOR_8191 [Sclerotinia borealis F-4128]
MREASLARYIEEPDTLYESIDQLLIDSSTVSLPHVDPHNFESSLVYLKHTTSRLTVLSFEDENNLFMHGMDCLQALLFTRDMKQAFGIQRLTANDIYGNRSLVSLAGSLQLASKQKREVKTPPVAEKTRLKNVEAMFAEFAA